MIVLLISNWKSNRKFEQFQKTVSFHRNRRDHSIFLLRIMLSVAHNQYNCLLFHENAFSESNYGFKRQTYSLYSRTQTSY